MRSTVLLASVVLVGLGIFPNDSHARKTKGCGKKSNCIERVVYDPSPASACIKAIKQAADAVESFCQFSGGVSTTMPSECDTEDASAAWDGKPMFRAVRVVGVLCNGNHDKENAAKAAMDLVAKNQAEAEAKKRAELEKSAKEAKRKADDAIFAALRANKELAAKQARERAEHERNVKLGEQKEIEEQAAKVKTENEVAARLCATSGADKKSSACSVQKSEEKKSVKSNSIDDAFSRMEEKTGKVPTAKHGNMDTEFAKVESFRAEQERRRVATLKAKQELEASKPKPIARHEPVDAPPAAGNAPAKPLPNGFIRQGGLIWSVLTEPALIFADAKEKCAGVFDGKTGWRLPTPLELYSAYSANKRDQSWKIDPYNVHRSEIWSAEYSHTAASGNSWHRIFNRERGGSEDAIDTSRHYVTCVRSG